MFKIFQNQKGTALLIALMMMLMLSLISIASVMTSVTDMDISQNAKQGTRAFYLAEAGIERSIAQLSDSISWRDGYTNEPLDGGTYNVLIQDSSSVPSLGQNLLITSTGDIYGARSTIEVTLAPNFKRRFTYGLFAEDDLTIRNEVLVDSYDSDSGSYASQAVNGPDSNGNMYASANTDVGSNGDVTIRLESEVHGDAFTYSGTFDIDAGSNLYGDTTVTATPTVIDPITSSEMNDALNNNNNSTGITLSGGATYDPVTYELKANGNGKKITLANGTYYFSKVEIKNNAVLELEPNAQVIIYMTDKFDVMNGSVANPSSNPSNLQIYSTGTYCRVKSSGAVFAGVIYAPSAWVTIHVGGDVYGSIVGNEVDVTNGSKFHYDEALARLNAPQTEGWEIISWREI